MKRLMLVMFLLLTACENETTTDHNAINFEQVNWYAKRAALAYQSEQDIKAAFPDTVLVATTPNSDVQYFLEQDPIRHRQIITIRGTANLRNIREDVEYIQSRNPKLGIYVHSGFDKDTYQIFQDLTPRLNKNHTTIVTGHSLGAAIATLLMMYLQEEGYLLGPSINFGQPKVTNRAGAQKYHNLPLLRVADENDLVPMVPPRDFLDSLHGAYEHIGPELMLLGGKFYTYQTHHQVEQDDVDSFWDNLGDESIKAHYMKHYLHNIALKLNSAEAVPYDQRERYIKQ